MAMHPCPWPRWGSAANQWKPSCLSALASSVQLGDVMEVGRAGGMALDEAASFIDRVSLAALRRWLEVGVNHWCSTEDSHHMSSVSTR